MGAATPADNARNDNDIEVAQAAEALRASAETMTGLELLEAIRDGRLPQAPMAITLGFHLTEVEAGRVVFASTPHIRHYNPIGVAHGGYAATLLDSCMGVALQTTAPAGVRFITLEMKLNIIKPLTVETGPITAEGKAVHAGRRTGVAEGWIRDAAGTLYAWGSTTCMAV